MILTTFLCFRNKNKLIRLRVFLKKKKNFLNPLNIEKLRIYYIMRKNKNTHQIILPLTTTYTHLYYKKWAIFTTQIILDTPL